MSTKARSFLGIEALGSAQIESILLEAARLKAELAVGRTPAPLAGIVVNLFFEPSTRTRVSFEIAALRLGLRVVNWTAQGTSHEKGESLVDTAQNIAAMGPAAIVVRHAAAGAPWLVAERVPCPVINAGDGAHEHPSQALLDALTLRERLGSLDGKVVAILGDIAHSRVARSNIFCLTRLGARVRLCGPPSFLLPGLSGLVPGGGVTVHTSLREGLSGADAVIALRVQRERLQGPGSQGAPGAREFHRHYGLTVERVAELCPNACILHPGPINRGVELAPEVADGPASAILAQVANGVAVRMAILSWVTASGSSEKRSPP